MGEIHEALKRAAAARQNEQNERVQPEAGPPRQSPPTSSNAPSVAEVAAAARGELPEEHSSAAPELSAADVAPRDRHPIPREKTGDWAPRAVAVLDPGGAAEAYRHFAIRVKRELAARNSNSAMVVSALRGEGKTTTACNLALALASVSGGERVALVDFDLRRPMIARVFGANPQLGIDDVLRRGAKLREACLATDLATLDLYPVATQMRDPHIHLSGSALKDTLAELQASYQTVIIDSPPVLLVPDAALIVPHVGGAIPVLRARHTRRRAFEQMLARMPEGSLLGSFLNAGVRPQHAKQYGYYREDEAATSSPSEPNS